MTYPKHTPIPDEEPPKPDYGRYDNQDGGDTVPDHGLVGEYAANVRHQDENGGASYKLTRLRPAPQDYPGPTVSQGRLFGSAVHRPEERYGPVPQSFTEAPTGEQLRFGDGARGITRSDGQAMAMRVDPGPHPVFFQRHNTPTLTGNGQEPAGPPNRAEAGRTIRSAVYRPEQRY